MRIKYSVIALMAVGFSASAWASTTALYDLNVSTDAISGTAGFLDFQFNPGGGTTVDDSTATFSLYSSDGTLGLVDFSMGGVTGFLPSAFSISNTGGLNDLTQNFTFGSYLSLRISIDTTVSGDADAGTGLFVSFFDANYQPIGSVSDDGTILNGQVGTDGSVAFVNGAATPEPSSLLLMAAGLIFLAARRKGLLRDVRLVQ